MREESQVHVKLSAVRKLALSLPDTTEEPRHNYGSFRVGGKIFVTVPPGDELLHVFLPESDREHALAMDPEFLEPVHWGGNAVGVRLRLSLAEWSTVSQLIKTAYASRAGKAPGGRKRAVKAAPPRAGKGKNAA